MRTTNSLLILGLVLGSFTLASGDAFAAGVDRRQHVQRARIHQGVVNGSLTHLEAGLLRVEQRHIQATKHRMRANDGHLGPAERARLNRMENRSSRHIRRARHN